MSQEIYRIYFGLRDGRELHADIPVINGENGARGTSILKVTTAPSSYKTAVGGFTPTYRISLSTVLSQAKVSEVLIGDTVMYSYYHYPVGYVDTSYVYLDTRNSIRGATGAAGADGTNGADGADGADGYTPVKGKDYWTPEDQENIIKQVVEALGYLICGKVDSDNRIVLSGDLDAGTYIVSYKHEDGTLTDIGTIVKDGADSIYDLNLIWREGVGINASKGGANAASHCAITDFIVVEPDAEYTLVQDGSLRPGESKHVYIRCYDDSGNYIGTTEDILDNSSNSTLITYLENTAMFRLSCEDNKTADGTLFKPALSVTTTKLSTASAVPYEFTFGVNLDKTTGAESASANYAASGFIEVDANQYDYKLFTVDASTPMNVNCFDANKNQIAYLAYVLPEGGAEGTQASADLELPAGTAFIRFRFYHGATEATANAYINKASDVSLVRYSKNGVSTEANLITISIDTDGSIFNGKGWMENKRLNSSGAVADVGSYGYTGVTGFIPISDGDVLTTSANMILQGGSAQQAVCFYDANKTFITRLQYVQDRGDFAYDLFTVNSDYSFSYRHDDSYGEVENAAYVRFCFAGITDGAVITKNGGNSSTSYTNVIPLSTDVNGNPYNGGLGYREGYRYSSSGGGDVVGSGLYTTGYIKCKDTDTLYFKNVGMNKDAGVANGCHMYTFDTLSATSIAMADAPNMTQYHAAQWDASGNIVSVRLTNNPQGADIWARFNTTYLGPDSIITINQPITNADSDSGYTNLIDTVGYADGMRMSATTGLPKEQAGCVATGYIPITAVGDVIRTSGVNFDDASAANNYGWCYLCVYDADKNFLGHTGLTSGTNHIQNVQSVGSPTGDVTITVNNGATVPGYIRLSGVGSGANLIVTKNEEITNTPEAFEVTLNWQHGYSLQNSIGNQNFGSPNAQEAYSITDIIPLEDGYAYTVYGKGLTSGVSCYTQWYTSNGGYMGTGGSASNGGGWSTSTTGDASFVLNPPDGVGAFRLQSYQNGHPEYLSAVSIEATPDSTKDYNRSIPLTWHEGDKLSKTDGSVEATGTYYNASDFIPVENKTYSLHQSVSAGVSTTSLIFFDSNKNFVSYVANVFDNSDSVEKLEYEFTPPANAAYLKLRQWTASAGTHTWTWKCVWLLESE